MKAAPLPVLGGRRPVVAYLRHSMIVVFPEPLYPTMSVRGVLKLIISGGNSPKLRIPEMANLSIRARR